MADRTRLPGSEFVSKDKVELMISQALEPINRKLGELQSHAFSFYGNGSGRRGKLEEMEDVQTERWEEQKKWRNTVDELLTKFNNTIVSKTAVVKDRRWLFSTALTLLSVIGGLVIEYLHKH